MGKPRDMKDKLIILLLIINLISGCGELIDDANANTQYQLVNLYGYECITNYASIWCR